MADTEEPTLEEVKECFLMFDFVGDNKIPAERIIDALRSLGLNPMTKTIRKMLESSKLAGQRVDFDTFLPIYEDFLQRPVRGTPSDFVGALEAFDKDLNGTVSAAELRNVLMNLGDKLDEQQAEAIILPFEDKHGKVDYRKLVAGIMAE